MQENSFLTEIANQFTVGDTSIVQFLLNLFVTIVLALIIGLVYSKYGNSLSNRKKLQQTFVLMAVTVMIVITIVKSSLALSLGLVGALSIVRFRTAIKEPEELVYFFIAIAVGLGVGANQRLLTIIGAAVIVLYIVIQNINSTKREVQQNLIVTFSNPVKGALKEDAILEVLKPFASKIDLRRLDESSEFTELSLNIEFNSLGSIMNAKNALREMGEVQFSFIESY